MKIIRSLLIAVSGAMLLLAPSQAMASMQSNPVEKGMLPAISTPSMDQLKTLFSQISTEIDNLQTAVDKSKQGDITTLAKQIDKHVDTFAELLRKVGEGKYETKIDQAQKYMHDYLSKLSNSEAIKSDYAKYKAGWDKLQDVYKTFVK